MKKKPKSVLPDREWSEQVVFDKEHVQFGDILNGFGHDTNFEFTMDEVVYSAKTGAKLGKQFEMKAKGNGFCDTYLDGKFIKTIPYPKDNIFRSEDFEL